MKDTVIIIRLEEESYQLSLQRLLEILLPNYVFDFDSEDTGERLILELRLLPADFAIKDPLVTELVLIEGCTRYVEQYYHYEILDERYGEFDYLRRGKDLLKKHLYTFLVEYLSEEISPWGILTGIRPTKLVHYLRDTGFGFLEIKEIFRTVYAVSPEKIDLLERVVKVEERYLPTREEADKRVSIYLGIPFCPSRCSYCSFPAFSLQKHGSFVQPFLEALYYEIRAVGEFIEKNAYQIDSIYIGGGTPTSLSSQQLEILLEVIAESFPVGKLIEYNVEAGRPDTINLDKLKVLFHHGVNRISINPQTMQQKTLNAIGRHHTSLEIQQVFAYAKEMGFTNINADLIIGLPGENFFDVQSTMREILSLKPDSVTVHTLSLKKASSWWETARELPFPEDSQVTRMLEYVSGILQENHLLPYYMYRQKYILGNQENVGYALTGKESLYNMIMIEERETVIGLGGGSVTKIVNSADWSLVRHSNPKYPGDYIKDIERIVADKLSLLTSH